MTYRCNSRCKMCNIWKMYDENFSLRENEIKGSVLIERIKSSSLLKQVNSFDITGGEPFLRDDLCDIITELFELKNINLITINTNGFMPSKILKDTEYILKNIPPGKIFSVSVSMDGLGVVHEKIRAVPGSFEKTVQTVKGLCDLREKFSNLELRSNAVIQKDNINELKDLKKFWNKHNIKGVFDLAHDNLYTQVKGFNDDIMSLDEKSIDNIKKISPKPQGMNYYIDNGFKRPLHCFAGFASMFIDAFGDIYPCNYFGGDNRYLMGNIKKDGIDEIWSSKRANAVRNMAKKCSQVRCWNGCEVTQTVVQYNPLDILLRRISFNLLGLYKLKKMGGFCEDSSYTASYDSF
ncbi:MAG: radical SAM protein [Armatimonadota bacterium]